MTLSGKQLLIGDKVKTRKKKEERHKSKESKEVPESSPTNNFLVGNYGLRSAERWEDMPSMCTEVGEI